MLGEKMMVNGESDEEVRRRRTLLIGSRLRFVGGL
jgi:hypothetical protein